MPSPSVGSVELLTPEVLAPRLGETIFSRPELMHHFESIPSTNSAAMQAAAAGAEEGTLFIAERQSGGRGRGNHGWHSEPNSGIYLSLILRPKLRPDEALWLSLIAGLATREAVLSVSGIAPDLRWPNDIMLGEKKLGGILSELSSDATRVRHAVIGIGINVNNLSFPDEIQSLATSLQIETGRGWFRVEIVAALLKSLDREYRELQADSGNAPKSIVRRFEDASSYARGAEVVVEDQGSGPTYSGMTAGLDARGFLLVQTDFCLRTLVNGGVRKRHPG